MISSPERILHQVSGEKRDQQEWMTSAERAGFSYIGVIEAGLSRYSAAVVGSRDTVVTAAHAFVRDGEMKRPLGEIAFAIHEGDRLKHYQVKRVTIGTEFPEARPDEDWAVIRLDVPVSKHIKPLGIWNGPLFKLFRRGIDVIVPAHQFDFSKQQVPQVSVGVASRMGDVAPRELGGVAENLLTHTASVRKNVSGAPLVVEHETEEFFAGIHVFGRGSGWTSSLLEEANFNVGIPLQGKLMRTLCIYLGNAAPYAPCTLPERLDPVPSREQLDNRRELREHELWLFSGVGRVRHPIGNCTGFLVGNRNTVATSAHCVASPETVTFLLMPQKPGDATVGEFRVKEIERGGSIQGGGDDWAILRLKEDVPQSVRPLSWMHLGSAREEGVFSNQVRGQVVAFHADNPRTRLLSECDSVTKVPFGLSVLIEHSCYIQKGGSGSPLIVIFDDEPVVIGINKGGGLEQWGYWTAVAIGDVLNGALRGLDDNHPSPVFIDRPGVDLPGADIEVLRDVGLDKCRMACAGDGRCRAFTFNEAVRWCFLKEAGFGVSPHEGAFSAVKSAN